MSGERLLDAMAPRRRAPARALGRDGIVRADSSGPAAATILALQRSAGNAEVAALLLGSAARRSAAGRALQREVETDWGTFDEDSELTRRPGGVGLDIELTFTPKHPTDATKIGLTQAVRSERGGELAVIDPSAGSRTVTQGTSEGYKIDRLRGRTNPIYGADSLKQGKTLADTRPTDARSGSADSANYQLGHRYHDGTDWVTRPAMLHDFPVLSALPGSSQLFETAALALAGAVQDRYLGSVQWGWVADAVGRLDKIALTKLSGGDPTERFARAATLWNAWVSTPTIGPLGNDGFRAATGDVTIELIKPLNSSTLVLATGTKLLFTEPLVPGRRRYPCLLPSEVTIQSFELAGWVATAQIGADDTLTVDVACMSRGQPAFKLAQGAKVKRAGVVGETTLISLLPGTMVTDLHPDLQAGSVLPEDITPTAKTPLPAVRST